MTRAAGAVGVAAFLGATHRGFLLCPSDEQHSFGAGESGEVLVRDVVLALPLNDVNLMLLPQHQIHIVPKERPATGRSE
ncbi:hypothetical protein [Frankia sp. Cas3]|uniref:hypothetical protein n=1 Tax=Frankia sp. Cas3 TaxID=3073926 RepID=UPI002AD47E9B|nr:hypothetical protein [Frankia sp. Cas3]